MHGCHDWVLWLCVAVLSLATSKEKNTVNPTIAITATSLTSPPTIAPIGADNNDAGTGVGAGVGLGLGVGFSKGLGVGEGPGGVLEGDKDWLDEVEVVMAVGRE